MRKIIVLILLMSSVAYADLDHEYYPPEEVSKLHHEVAKWRRDADYWFEVYSKEVDYATKLESHQIGMRKL